MTFTKEWLQQTISGIEAIRDEIPFGLDEDERNTLEALKFALAAMTAEPVAWVMKDDLADIDIITTPAYPAFSDAVSKTIGELIPLYASPSAPVSVPECFERLLSHAYGMTMGHDWNKGTMAGHHREKLCQAVEECRAAMLHGAEPVQEWIPCSERMPNPKTGVMVGCWFGREWAVKWATYLPYHPDAHKSGFLMPGGSWTPTHWMPLPAAPQQEVK